jgi:2,3-bisphosphoglycerate-independent phosphoglycerate mutase
LIILDGWGNNPDQKHNAIATANTPTWDQLNKTAVVTNLAASGTSVGLPPQQMGNSEVGHLCIGAGRVIEQDLTRINKDNILNNQILLDNIKQTLNSNKNIHILGLLSDGGVHSHESHLHALLELIHNNLTQQKYNLHTQIFLHAFLDGRDTPPKSATKYLDNLSNLKIKNFNIASISGRFFAMDRDNRFERTQLVYDLLTSGTSQFQAATPIDALQQGYERNETDEFITPTIINSADPIDNDDLVIFYNFRADRTRQLCYALTKKDFTSFNRLNFPNINLLTFTKYADDIATEIAFPPPKIRNSLSEYLAIKNLTQLKIAETEKYPHVTFFFNGGEEEPFFQEDRLLIASPKVASYDSTPQMSAEQITKNIIYAIEQEKYAFIAANFANADMVGHTGNLPATIAAIETIDISLKKIIAIAKQYNTDIIITADHGNAELMYDQPNQQPLKSHTNFPVPFIYVGSRKANLSLTDNPSLQDIAPTILNLLGITKPREMTGNSLLAL